MKTLAATAAALTLLWAQCLSGLTPARTGATAQPAGACACADCRGACCCVQTPEPAAPLTPIAPQRAGSHDFSAIPTLPSLAGQLPQADHRAETAFADASLNRAAVPLFSRHCARLL